ncbi:MAG: hypothetical protein QNK14_03730 [Desulfobacterales bacterium]|nr:hypothetical protein [Desulfobacterales bacterium]
MADGIREVRLGAYRTKVGMAKGSNPQQEPPWYGTVCPVVWEMAGVTPPPTRSFNVYDDCMKSL